MEIYFFSILLSVYNKRTPIFLEHLRVSPIRGHMVLKLPVFQTPMHYQMKGEFCISSPMIFGKIATLLPFQPILKEWINIGDEVNQISGIYLLFCG